MGLSVQCSLLKRLLVIQTGFHIFQLGITLQKLTTFPKHQICEVDKDSGTDLWKNRISGFFSRLLLPNVAPPVKHVMGVGGKCSVESGLLWTLLSWREVSWREMQRTNSPLTEISRSLVLNVGGSRFWFSERQSSHQFSILKISCQSSGFSLKQWTSLSTWLQPLVLNRQNCFV